MDNRTLYDVGCSYPELCRKNSLGVVFGRRSGDRGHILCHRCCDESVCNAHTTCDDDSTGLFMQKYQATLNKTLFDLGCKRSTMCTNRLQSNVLGRSTEEEKHLLCETCCYGDSICNRDLVCSHHNLASINDSCSSSSDCMRNLICKSEKCTCPIDDYYWSIDTCKYSIHPSVNCTRYGAQTNFNFRRGPRFAAGQPNNSSQRGSSANPRAAVRFQRPPFHEKSFNAVCKSSDECFDSLYCNHGICKCDRIDYWGGQKCYRKKGVGQGCYYSNDCKLSLLCLNHTCKCNESHSWNGASCKLAVSYPSECADIYFNSDGVFNIYPKGKDNPVPVFCKLEDGTRWTVIQRRTNGSVDFYKTWNEYKLGFGSVHGEYWLGNDFIHKISTNGRHKLRIYLESDNGTSYIAEYSTFRVGDENTNYLINVTGYSGSAGDSMDRVEPRGRANGFPFSTMDRDNDNSTGSCAKGNRSGWWYSNCCHSDLNENYYTPLQMRWITSIGFGRKSRMMITKY
ncbi:Tenascin-R,Ryncolin-2,Angiopoietin-related protein 1,Angiopoietin-related protein 6,Ryncolin-1,Fibrinogen C domain-containing protein 1-A,Fibrinogen C domain-containing protein 1,Angiopoietin-1,Fibrinogen C domain-containing protein 1-B,Ficolin-2,Fibrinogen-like protein 1,Tenascin,Ficolin-1,Microfibril-associated glycoprotein 4,Ryncolin-3 [Mytilus edulis]|uniref:Fibrinogen C-terminal domain-containing protein n=1 Tax=Mytilus edulis TaxID=6550 RepID=A0A8S3UK49_MYTED|nr:Tenascin-R,Ryncolin-2,Angiopoietin-related protein 1,Angiopoietin-related protein 6,Ryncolin-1,Fibrinogen C domain-containing protein 1-A,Fibrinogen C domain-containing protein 1,Angiopoietin-1,Fibrinogen C domain-containing protein 1-B,Ficolin-2,Fibrinogen-like protein 1,Tenascin,Ficolin-1,Microfibril-associated glycoprotein 4,Ryncolin-3 [Mytilus edulis]